jgi:LysM repeat protein
VDNRIIASGQPRLRVTSGQAGASPAVKTPSGQSAFSKILRRDDLASGGGGSESGYGRQAARDPLSRPQSSAAPPKSAPAPAASSRQDRMAGFITQHSMVPTSSGQQVHGATMLKGQDMAPLGRVTAAPTDATPAATEGTSRYQVKAGDSLWKIAREHNVDWRDLARINNISNPSLIRAGQEILLPAGASASASAPALASASPAGTAPAAAARPAPAVPRPAGPVDAQARAAQKFNVSPAAGAVPFSAAPKAAPATGAAQPAAARPIVGPPQPAAAPAAAAAPRPFVGPPRTAAAPQQAARPAATTGPFAASPSAAPELGRMGPAFAPRSASAAAPSAVRPAAGPAAASGVASTTSAQRTADSLKAFGLDEKTVDQILHRTSKYEGGYSTLNRNTDKAGLSFGFIQFAQKPGSLGQVLGSMAKKNPAKFNQIFGPDAQQMLKVVTQGPDHGVDAHGRATNPKFDLTKEPWVGRFEAAGKDPEFQGVQRDVARKHYFAPMLDVAQQNGIKSPEGLSMLFDTSVQQGRSGMERILRHAAQKRTPGMGEREFLELVAKTAAKAAGPRWQKNVLERRMGILQDPEIAQIGKSTASQQG